MAPIQSDLVLFTRTTGIMVAINSERVFYIQPLASAEHPNARAEIYLSPIDFIRVRETFDEVLAKLGWTATQESGRTEVGLTGSL